MGFKVLLLWSIISTSKARLTLAHSASSSSDDISSSDRSSPFPEHRSDGTHVRSSHDISSSDRSTPSPEHRTDGIASSDWSSLSPEHRQSLLESGVANGMSNVREGVEENENLGKGILQVFDNMHGMLSKVTGEKGAQEAGASRRRRRGKSSGSSAARRRRRRRRRSSGGGTSSLRRRRRAARRRAPAPSPTPPAPVPSPTPPVPVPVPGPAPVPGPSGGQTASSSMAPDYERKCSPGSKKISPGTSASSIASAAKSGKICLTKGRYTTPITFSGLGNTIVEAEEGALIDGTVAIPDNLWQKDTSVGAGVYKANVASICGRGSSLMEEDGEEDGEEELSSLIEEDDQSEADAFDNATSFDGLDDMGKPKFKGGKKSKKSKGGGDTSGEGGGSGGGSGGGRGGGRSKGKGGGSSTGGMPQRGCLSQLFINDRAVTDARWPNVQKSTVDPDTAFNHEPPRGSAYTEIGAGATWAKVDAGSSYMNIRSKQLAGLKKSVPGAVIVAHKWTTDNDKADGMLDGQDVSYTKVRSHSGGSTSLSYEPHDRSVYGGNPSNWKLKAEKIEKGKFYVTAHLDLLDKEDEWFYDPAKQTVWVWPKGGGAPKGARARIYNNMLTVSRCTGTTFKGLQVFAGTVFVDGSKDVTFEGARFLYGSAGARMHGYVGRADDAFAASGGSGITVKHSEIGFSESRLVNLRTTKNYFYNNYLHNCCWGSTESGAVSDKKGGQTIWRRNTIHTIGKGCGIKAGPGGTRMDYNLVYNLYYDTDSSNLQIPTGSAEGSVVAHNWLLFGWSRNGMRYDGDPAGEHGLSYRTVSFNNNMNFRIKGNFHWFLHNTGFGHGPSKTDASFAKNKWCSRSQMVQKNAKSIGCPKGSSGGNSGTKQYNAVLGSGSAGESYSEFAGTASKGAASGILVARLEGLSSKGGTGDAPAVCAMLRDPLNLDFRPKPGSRLVNKGTSTVWNALKEGEGYWQRIKDSSYAGWADFVRKTIGGDTELKPEVDDGKPDIGAYESDPDEYWIPGVQHERSACTPVPFNGAEGVTSKTHLMWLPAAKCIEMKCTQTVTLNGKEVGSVKAPNNVVRLSGSLSPGSRHIWSVDSSGLGRGPSWSFTVARSEKDVCGRMSGIGHGEGDADEYIKEEKNGRGGGTGPSPSPRPRPSPNPSPSPIPGPSPGPSPSSGKKEKRDKKKQGGGAVSPSPGPIPSSGGSKKKKGKRR